MGDLGAHLLLNRIPNLNIFDPLFSKKDFFKATYSSDPSTLQTIFKLSSAAQPNDGGVGSAVPLKYIGSMVDVVLARQGESETTLEDTRNKYKKVGEIAFNLEKRYHVVVYEKDDSYWLIMKGAMDAVFSRCSKVKDCAGGKGEKEFDEKNRGLEKTAIENRSAQSVSFAQAIIPKSAYPDGLDVNKSEEALLKDLCYVGSAFYAEDHREVLQNANKRTVLITGMPIHQAAYQGRACLPAMTGKDWTLHGDTVEEMKDREMYDNVEEAHEIYGDYAVADGTLLQSATPEDLAEMLFGTEQLVVAKASPLVKVNLLSACIANDVIPVFTSSLTISGTPVDKAKAAVQKCREAGVKAVLLTSLTGAEARSQAVELGVFTSESKTINDIATRLNVSVEKVWPRQGRSLIVTQEEMKKMKDDKIRKVLKKYDEVVFSGLTQEQKDVIELFTWQFTLFVMC